MENYIDKINYGNNKYFLLDSGALHDATSHLLIGTNGDFNVGGNLNAENAFFTDIKTKTLNADRATIAMRLDVNGDFHTNSWTASNISTIEGAFYITPTVSCESGTFNYNGSTITISGRNGTQDLAELFFEIDDVSMVNTNDLPSEEQPDSESNFLSWWTRYSFIILTGEILVNNEWRPLGSILGMLLAITREAVNGIGKAKSITIGNLQNNKGGATISTLDDDAIGEKEFRNIKVSLYKRASINAASAADLRNYPIGIYMTALGDQDSIAKTFIDIYGGTELSGTATGSGALAIPKVRIGNLNGLPNIETSLGEFTPNGWGIYTTNGFFEGVIVAQRGFIGNYTIGSTALYSGSHSSWNSEEEGIYLSSDYISAGEAENRGGELLPPFYVSNSGELHSINATIEGKIVATSGEIGNQDGLLQVYNPTVVGDSSFILLKGDVYFENDSIDYNVPNPNYNPDSPQTEDDPPQDLNEYIKITNKVSLLDVVGLAYGTYDLQSSISDLTESTDNIQTIINNYLGEAKYVDATPINENTNQIILKIGNDYSSLFFDSQLDPNDATKLIGIINTNNKFIGTDIESNSLLSSNIIVGSSLEFEHYYWEESNGKLYLKVK